MTVIRPMHFNLFMMDTGHHEASWRLPGSYPLANIDIEYFERMAQRAESVMFDSVFLADEWERPARVACGIVMIRRFFSRATGPISARANLAWRERRAADLDSTA